MLVPSILVSATLATLAVSCGKEPPKPPRPTVVDAVVARIADVPVVLTAIGTVEPVQEVEVRPQVSGVIQEVLFSEGQAVTPGQVLFRLDRRPFEAARLQVSAQSKTARIQADAARRNLERGRPLYEKKIISEGEFDGLTAASQAADAAVEVQEAALRTAKLNLEYTTIRAPIPGRAGRLLAYPGDVVTANSTPLVQVNQTAPINVRFSVPEKDIGAVRQAAAAGEIPVVARLADSGQTVSGRLTFIDNQVDQGTGSLALKAVFDNADESLWPGQFVQITAETGVLKDVVVVPSHAVQNGQKGTFVFLVGEDGKARFQAVETGRTTGGDTVIVVGVSAGQVVVTDGQMKLSDGSPVEVRSAAGGESR